MRDHEFKNITVRESAITAYKSEKAIVFIGVLALVAILALLSTLSVTSTFTEINMSQNYKTNVQATYAAEAGYNELIGKYLNNTNFFISKETATAIGLPDSEPITANFDNLAYWFPSITYDTNDPPDYVDVESYGKVWGTNSIEKIKVRITPLQSSPFNYGIFGNGAVTLSGNGETDSYNSETDPSATTLLSNGDVGTNATGEGVITLNGNAVINGDAQVGPGGDPVTDITLNGNAEIIGDTSAADIPKDMNPVTDPGGGTPETLSISGNNTKTISTGIYRLPSISISGNATGKISGDVTLYLDGNTSISGNGMLEILPGASLTIYASGTVNISGNGIVNLNPAPRPKDCIMLGTSFCTSVSISGNGDLYAAIYAPAAACSITGNGDIYGSLIGDTISIPGNGDVLYDESLKDLSVGEISDFKVKLWRFLDI